MARTPAKTAATFNAYKLPGRRSAETTVAEPFKLYRVAELWFDATD
jgi:hypothetical protein